MSANITSAATSPSLGSAGTYGLLGGTFTPNGGSTTITGDVGYTTLSAGLYTVIGGGVDCEAQTAASGGD